MDVRVDYSVTMIIVLLFCFRRTSRHTCRYYSIKISAMLNVITVNTPRLEYAFVLDACTFFLIKDLWTSTTIGILECASTLFGQLYSELALSADIVHEIVERIVNWLMQEWTDCWRDIEDINKRKAWYDREKWERPYLRTKCQHLELQLSASLYARPHSKSVKQSLSK